MYYMDPDFMIIIIIIMIIIIIIIITPWPGSTGLAFAGNSHVSWAGEVLYSLGWQSPRDGVSINILVVVQPKNH